MPTLNWYIVLKATGAPVTLFQLGGADYAHHIPACARGFENLTASLPKEREHSITRWVAVPKMTM